MTFRQGPISNRKQGAVRRSRKQLPGKVKNPNYGGGVPPSGGGTPPPDQIPTPPGPGPLPPRPVMDRNGAKPGLGWGRGGRFGQGLLPMPPRPHPIPQPAPGPSLNDQFQTFLQQDPSALGIASTQTLADIMGEYGDFSHGGGAFDAGSTLQQTIRNKFLGTLSPQDSARAQNHMGYFTGGERVNAPQGGFQFSGSLPELEPGQTWMAQNNGVNYGSYSRGDDGGYSWNPIGDNAGAYGVQPGTTDRQREKPDSLSYRRGRTRPRRGPGRPRF